MNWDKYAPYFKKSEFDCKHTGNNEMQEVFMDKLLNLRVMFNKPMVITSGYRHGTHPVEINKTTKGAHTMGRACDIAVVGFDAHVLLRMAFDCGFTGIGVNQKGSGRFIHLDDLPNSNDFPRPTVWSY